MILQVIASSRGGGAVHVRELALGLQQEGLAVVVLMGEDHGHIEAGDFTGAEESWRLVVESYPDTGLPVALLQTKRAIALAQLDIHPGDVVWDIGAGSGWFTIHLAQQVGPRGIVYAQDVQREM
jgi:hypothetical protein